MNILNDVHIGVDRINGTTAASRLALRYYLRDNFRELVMSPAFWADDLCLLGDLFDGPNIPLEDLYDTYLTLTYWLEATDRRLFLVNGNHDLSKDSSVKSSFQLLAGLLVSRYPEYVVHIDRPTKVRENVYIIPHLTNQAEFDQALAETPACQYLLVHANYDNHFARQADHSLNLSAEQAASLPVGTIVFAHEHQQRTGLAGKVQVIGNQWASSIADCLGNDTKRYATLAPAGIRYTPVSRVSDFYREVDWRELETADDTPFVRVVGAASDVDSATAVRAISDFRGRSSSYVITNAVQIGTSKVDAESFESAMASVAGFDAITSLRRLITDPLQTAMLEASIKRVAPEDKADF
jgi:metallophosphoesterase superfamily enzyme